MDRPLFSADLLLFWTALALLAYVYIGYPIVGWLRAALFPGLRCRGFSEPTVTVIVVAHNEADRVGPRLENLLALDYPRERLEIVLASDGSTDNTVARARRYEDRGVRVQVFSCRRGKAAVLNDVVPSSRGQIVVLADARQRFDPGAVRALVANFVDLSVGAVSGELVLTPPRDGAVAGQGACFYWRYETFIRRNESRARSMVGATGAIYAIRRSLFEPIPADTILDDVLIPMRILKRGYLVLLERGARAYDGASATARQEFSRKARTIAGTFQLFARDRWLLNPFLNPVWFETVSHKGLRLVTPVLHFVVLAANVSLADLWPYQWLLAGQLLFYGAALAGCLHPNLRRRLHVLTVPYAVCLLTWATVVGFFRFAAGRQLVTWDRVAPPAHTRPAPVMSAPARTPKRTRALLRS